MCNLDFYLHIFNNREKAIIIWIFILIILFLSNKGIRSSLLNILKILFTIKFLSLIGTMISYVGLIVLILYKVKLWDVLNIGDTVIWFIGTGFILLLNTKDALIEKHYFRKILLENVRFVLVLEFIINIYPFSLWIELIILPFLFFLGFMHALAEEERYLSVRKVIDVLLSICGLVLIVFFIYSVLEDFRGFATIHNLRSLLLPPVLTLVFIPFLYLFAVIMEYEDIFCRIDHFLSVNKASCKSRDVKLGIFRLCFLDLRKLRRFSSESVIDISNLRNKEDVSSMIRKFKTKVRNVTN